jgi:hypothetical protein
MTCECFCHDNGMGWCNLCYKDHGLIETGAQPPRNQRGWTPKLVQESGWQSDGQIGATGSKI